MPKSPLLAAALVATPILAAVPAHASFSGDLAFMPDGCMTRRECILRNPLTFVDPGDRVWRAEAGDVTDGASIPDWAQSIIGGPWDEAYLKAAVVHDHYCDRHLASWRETHLMFYDALIDLGMNEFKAKLMYYAVYLGGPRWIDVLSFVNCGRRAAGSCKPGSTLEVMKTISRPARYGGMDMHAMVQEAEDYMKINPDASLQDLERMAQSKHPDDMYYRFGGGVLADVAAQRGVR